MKSRHFGELPPGADYVETKLAQGAEPVRVNMNLKEPAAFTADELARVDRLLDGLARLDEASRGAIRAAMADTTEQPLPFWQFHREEVEGYEQLEREGFVDALRLARVGLYPDGAHGARAYAVMDYVLRGPPTDQILAVKHLEDGTILAIAWES